MSYEKYLCPVCKQHYFRMNGTHEVCPVCEWINDSVQNEDPDYVGGANIVSQNEWRKQWQEKQTIKE